MIPWPPSPTTLHSWIIAPVLLPLVTGGVMLLLGDGRRRIQALVNVASTLAGLVIGVLLLLCVDGQDAPAAFGVYLPGNWPVPFGIVLIVDRLSALMLVLTGTVAIAALVYSLVRWHHAGVSFHVLFQLQLMGLYGAFLTGDLFNLFVFFEVLLAASYGLLLHGGGRARVRSGLHYVTVNLLASLLFLIGVAVLYGVTGTLNMADIAMKLPDIAPGDRGLLHAGAAILAVALLTKAAVWPLNFWLPGAYSAASAPVAALFAILTKVGIYGVLRLWTLWFPESAGASALFGGDTLVWVGIVTLAFGAAGMLASQLVGRLAAFSVIVSSGTMIATIGFNLPALGGGALYYLTSSALAGCALFLLVELLERSRQELPPAPIDDGQDELPSFSESRQAAIPNLDDDKQVLVGRAIPAALAFLGLAFTVCALVVAGLPPLSGFIGKLTMLSALLDVQTPSAWVLFGLLIVSSLMAAMALVRVGMRHFWSSRERPVPRLRVGETLPIAVLLTACVGLVIKADPALEYMRATAESLHEPGHYVNAVQSAKTVAAPRAREIAP